MSGYQPRKAEIHWQKRWADEGVFEASPEPGREKFYCVEMLPYPSGRIHMGHVRNYSIGDALAWFWRLRGRNVLHPIGWDALGLPAENAAIERGSHPAEWTRSNIDTMRAQLQELGFSYAWSGEVGTDLPEYYRWNQWFFLRMYENDLVYRAKRALNWCPRCDTVLANEQVLPNGNCYRHDHTPVELVEIDQWFIRTTRFAEELLAGIDGELEAWPEEVRLQQANWIGRSEGCRVRFAVDGLPDAESIEVFTTRVDTIYGCSFLSLAAAHPRALELAAGTPQEDEVRRFVEEERSRGLAAAAGEVEKRGVFCGREAVNPFNGERVPILLANFVLMEFGTGAVFGQPAHDQRDFEFATELGLPIRPVIRPEDGGPREPAAMTEAFTEPGVLHGSGEFDGMDVEEAGRAMAAKAEREGFGGPAVMWRLRDWGVSRQRYWGTPIPMVFCDDCGVVPVPEDRLPVVLPSDVQMKGGTGSPLARHEAFVHTDCPRCGGPARRETDTMDTFVDSSWYFFRYVDPHNETLPFERAKADYWFPIDFYVGGIEHAVGHLIYCRFWTRMMHQLGLCSVEEPVRRLLCQGMVNARSFRCENHDYVSADDVLSDGEGGSRCKRCGQPLRERVEKMSKSKYNSVSPDALLERHGADAMRLFSLFAGPPVKGMEWTEEGIEGLDRFVHRVARLYDRLAAGAMSAPGVEAIEGDAASELHRKTHETIARVTADLEERLQPNTAIAAIMELVNQAYRYFDRPPGELTRGDQAALRECLDVLARVLAPFAPHLAEEAWARLGHRSLVARASWPDLDPAALRRDEITLGVQVNGKRRGEIVVARDVGEEAAVAAAWANPGVARHLEGKVVRKIILVRGRLLNLVVQ